MKKAFSVCLALMLLLACIPVHVSAEGSPTFAVGTAEARVGDTIEIPVMIENNPGLVAFRVTVSFDTDVLTLQSAVSENLFTEGTLTFGGSYETDTFKILWENGLGANQTVSGTFATLTFLVSEDAPEGDTTISIDYSSSSTFSYDPNSSVNYGLTDVSFVTRAGAVTVLPAVAGGWSFSEDCTLRTYEGYSGEQYVIGLDISYPVISEYIETTGGWSFDVELNDWDMESTGAKLVIYNEKHEVVEEYWSVLFGDIDGDGVVDGTDVTLLLYTIGTALDEPWAQFSAFTDEFPQSFAADADHSLVLDGTDMTCMIYQIGGREDIVQVIEEE